jgi:hypothetical protein
MLHPLVLSAVALLLVNDHLLKSAWSGFLTGKLSDLAGLAFFPVVLVSLWELSLAAVGRWTGPRGRGAVVAVGLTGGVFVLVKTSSEGARAFGQALTVGQWLLMVPSAVLSGSLRMPGAPGVIVVDPYDLLALPALLIALAIMWRRVKRAHDSG